MLVTPAASAFCRTRVCEFPDYDEPCEWDAETQCSLSSPVTFWAQRCISFAVQRDGSGAERISASELEAVVEDGFRVWSELSCGAGVSVELAAASQGPIACDAVEYNCNDRDTNSNIVMFRDELVDSAVFDKFGTIALTTATANFSTGELLDADIEINSFEEDFVLDDSSTIRVSAARDLRAVLYHELGHLLGLSHSREAGSLMAPSYLGIVDPGDDDRAGACEMLGSSRTDPVCDAVALGSDTACLGSDLECRSSRREAQGPEGCGCRMMGPRSHGHLGRWLALLGVAAGWRRRRAHLRRARSTPSRDEQR